MQRGNPYYEARLQHYYNAYMNAYLNAASPEAGAQQPAINQAIEENITSKCTRSSSEINGIDEDILKYFFRQDNFAKIEAYVQQLCHNEVKAIRSKVRTSSSYRHWLALGIRRVKKMLLDVYEKEDMIN